MYTGDHRLPIRAFVRSQVQIRGGVVVRALFVTPAELVEAVVQEAPPGKARAASAHAEAEHRGGAKSTSARARERTGGRLDVAVSA